MLVKDLITRDNNNIDLVRIILSAMVIVGHTYRLSNPGNFHQDIIERLTHFAYSGSLAVKVFLLLVAWLLQIVSCKTAVSSVSLFPVFSESCLLLL